jgi:ABC-type nitrate/sulfonate/bicarbonate transport system substrate-binding protein
MLVTSLKALLIGLGLLMIWSVPGIADTALERITLQLRWFHQFQFAGYYAALENGYYRDVGLDVVIQERDLRQDPVDVVASGQAEYGVTNSELLLHALQGNFRFPPTHLFCRPDPVFKKIDSPPYAPKAWCFEEKRITCDVIPYLTRDPS